MSATRGVVSALGSIVLGGRRSRGLGLLVAVAAGGALASPASASQPQPTERLHLAMGDSVAYGLGASDPSRTSYAALLTASLQDSRRWHVDRLVNLGRPGETTQSILDGQLQAALTTIADPATDARVLTLTIGANDVLSSPACAADPVACGLAERYATLLERLRSALRHDPGREALVVTTIMNPWSGTGSPQEGFGDDTLAGTDGQVACSTDAARTGLNDVLACVGRRLGARIADVYSLATGRGAELSHVDEGDLHPNDAGYRLIADALAAALGLRHACSCW